MKTWSVLLVALCMAIGVIGCSGGGTDTSEPTAALKADAPLPAPEPAVAVTPAPEPAPAPAAPAAPADAAAPAAAPTAGGLDGTTWKVGEFTVAFLAGGKITLSGGDLQGIEGTYTLENGTVTVSALGQSKSGTWDGSILTIDDKPAQKL